MSGSKQSRISAFVASGFRRRKLHNLLMCALLGVAAVAALAPLFSILAYVITKGIPGLNLDFFTKLPSPVGEAGGGMANALVGTLEIVLLASLFGIGWGMAIGVYLPEFGRGKVGQLIRFATEMLASIPSIIIGLFVYVLVVVPMKRFSALAGAIALGLIMIPTVARATEEILKMVPLHIREAGLALGLPRWKVTLQIVLKGSLRGIITGVMLSIARAAGETAPLLFTAFNNQYWSRGVDQPTASLPVQIYTYAISPFEDWHTKAWAGALILILFVLTLNVVTRMVLRPAGKGSHE